MKRKYDQTPEELAYFTALLDGEAPSVVAEKRLAMERVIAARTETVKAKAKARKANSETTLQKKIADRLVDRGYLVTRINSHVHFAEDEKHGGGFDDENPWRKGWKAGGKAPIASYTITNTNSHSGFSDLIVMADSIITLTEIKTQIGRLSESQRKFQALAERFGMRYVVLRSVEDADREFPITRYAKVKL